MTALPPRAGLYGYSSLSAGTQITSDLVMETSSDAHLPSDTHLPSGMSPLNQTYSLNGRPDTMGERLESTADASLREREFHDYR